MSLRVCIIGAGNHSRICHLPALAHYNTLHPGRVSLAAICDVDRGRALGIARQFGISDTYTSVDEMVSAQKPDACLAITPVSVNAAVAIRLLKLGNAVLMEKPIGATLEEAEAVVKASEQYPNRTMVSMNRRFDPLLQEALQWIGERKVEYVRATMARHNRREPAFLEQTGVHLVDAVIFAVGPVCDWAFCPRRMPDGILWHQLEITFVQGARGIIDIMPTAGDNAEYIEFFGSDFRVEVHIGDSNAKFWRAWSCGQLVADHQIEAGVPDFVANGTYRETAAFLNSLLSAGPMAPSPAEVLSSIQLCHYAAEPKFPAR